MQAGRVLISIAIALVIAEAPSDVLAQHSRRGGGVRVGSWNVKVAPWVDRSAHFEGYVHRALGNDLALENSVGVWRAVVNETRAYIVPLMTSLRYYPLSAQERRMEPFVTGGVGIAFGIQDVPDNAVGGTGSTIVTGIGVRAGLGVEVLVARGFGIGTSGKYQWVHFGDEVGTMETFAGVGWEGAVFYRFP